MKALFKAALITAASLLILVWGFWLVAVAPDAIENSIVKAFEGQGVDAAVSGLNKGWFYSFEVETLKLSVSGRPVVSAKDLDIKLGFIDSILNLSAVLNIEGVIAGGRLSGRISKGRSGAGIELKAGRAGVRGLLNEASLIEVGADGSVDAELSYTEGKGGFLRFNCDDLNAKDAQFAGLSLPLSLLSSARGMADIDGQGNMEIKSLALEGRGFYARLTGSVKRDVRPPAAKLKLEITEEGIADGMGISGAMIEPYMVSKGHYVIPIETRFGR